MVLDGFEGIDDENNAQNLSLFPTSMNKSESRI
jgi:hypothetical protein